jgi:hypothetical protein
MSNSNYIDGSTYWPKTDSDPVRCWKEKPPGDDVDYWWDGPGYYFYNETWADLYGPFATLKACEEALDNYASAL